MESSPTSAWSPIPQSPLLSRPDRENLPNLSNRSPSAINSLAQTRLSFLKEEWLKVGTGLCKALGVVAVGSMAASVYFVSLPALLCSGAAVVVCLLGIGAIKQERKQRLKGECQEIEFHLLAWKEAFESFQAALLAFKQEHSPEALTALEQAGLELKEKLGENPGAYLTSMRKRWTSHYAQLFGELSFIDERPLATCWNRTFFASLPYLESLPRELDKLSERLGKCLAEFNGDTDLLFNAEEATLNEKQKGARQFFNFLMRERPSTLSSPGMTVAVNWLDEAKAHLATLRATL